MTRRRASFLLALALLAAAPFAANSQSTILTVQVNGFPECSDTIDNDGDTFIDFGLDPECDSALDTSEAPYVPPEIDPGGGSGGGGSGNASGNSAVFRGKAYPGSGVTLLKDGQFTAFTNASPDGSFDITLRKLSAGTYTFSVYGTDTAGRRSTTHTFTVRLTRDVTNIITGIFLPPTIAVDKAEVRYGDIITILGQATPSSEVTVFVNSEREVITKVPSDRYGAWLLNFDTTQIEYGDHSTKARASRDSEVSPLSSFVAFKVGTANVPLAVPGSLITKGDLNKDNRINIVDFSILAYWFKRPGLPQGIDLNGDGQITIVDFSIVAFHWNG